MKDSLKTNGAEKHIQKELMNRFPEFDSDPWRIDTAALLQESLGNSSMAIMNIPFNIFGKMLGDVAERAIVIDDPVLNLLMIRLGLYSAGLPQSPDFNSDTIKEVEEKARKTLDRERARND